MLFHKTAELYRYARNETTKISSYSKVGNISCNIQPAGDKDGLNSGRMYKGFNLYTEYENIKVGDKIKYLGNDYIVNSIDRWDGLLRKYIKVLIEMSEGN